MANKYLTRKLSARYPTDLPAWRKLNDHYREDMWEKHLRDLHRRDKKRVEKFSLTANDLTLDYSKTHVNATTRKLLVQLAKQAGVADAIEAMFAGEKINKTEDRSVLHVALRAKISDMVALETTARYVAFLFRQGCARTAVPGGNHDDAPSRASTCSRTTRSQDELPLSRLLTGIWTW